MPDVANWVTLLFGEISLEQSPNFGSNKGGNIVEAKGVNNSRLQRISKKCLIYFS